MALEYAPLVPFRLNPLSKELTNPSQCEPQISYTFSNEATSITSVTITANDDSCDVPIPVTFPQTAAVRVDGGDVQVEQIGTEPVVLWVKLDGEPLSFTLDEPVSL